MTRSRFREELFKVIFRFDFIKLDEAKEQLVLFLEDEDSFSDEEKTEFELRYEEITKLIPKLDDMIDEKVVNWNTDRIGKAELTILRIAVYEILFDEKVPAAAAINEAVELAKKYGDEGASKFINGVLAKFVNE